MFSAWILLILNSLCFPLRVSELGGSFPRPLKAEEERRYLARWAEGDMEARNVLIEHNLRLVAHIVKKGESGRRRPPALCGGRAPGASPNGQRE